jgi:hypothetical protein
LRESTRQKIQILSPGKRQQQVLEECLGPSLPEELITGEPIANANVFPMEKQLRDFVSIEKISNSVYSAPSPLKMTDLGSLSIVPVHGEGFRSRDDTSVSIVSCFEFSMFVQHTSR